MRNSGLDEAQAGIKLGKVSIASDMQMTPPLCQKAKTTQIDGEIYHVHGSEESL